MHEEEEEEEESSTAESVTYIFSISPINIDIINEKPHDF